MTAKEAIALAAAVRPNALAEEVQMHFLAELEGRIAAEIYQKPCPPCTPVFSAVPRLSVPSPYDRVYWSYLVAMIDLAAGDAAAYRASSALFEEAYQAFARRFVREGGAV